VTAAVLQAYAGWLDGEGYAYATEYLELTTLKQAMKWMAEERLLPTATVPRLTLPKPVGTTTYCWKPAEVIAIVDFCRADPATAWLADIVVALAFTGMRISELANLRWSDIDLAAGTIRLTDESTQAPRAGRAKPRTLKTGRGRSLQIHPDLRTVLARLPRAVDGYVFHGPHGGRLKADTVRNIFVRSVLDPLSRRFPTPAGEVGFRDGRLHSFRHFFCSICADDGVAEAVVMAWLGHRNSDMVRHYYHLFDAEAKRQMQRVRSLDENGGAGAAAS
jgi:integrase